MAPEAASDRVLRVLVADDHPVVRRGLVALLGSLDGLDVVGEVADGAEAVREAQLLRPDVVVMDVSMPGIDGLEATRRITRAVPSVAVLVLTLHDDDDTVFSALQAGAGGYLLKGAGQDEIVRALRSVAAGEAIFGPGVAQRILGYLTSPPPAPDVAFPALTPREREVLDLIARGASNARISTELGLAAKTVGNHVSSIFAKLAVAGRAEAIVRAREQGLGRAAPAPTPRRRPAQG
ncbi:response regulator transcription factor [Isoptericola sp. NPDC019482]|uniref:response regulator transcription factor n=1 Tax=Isoptericola sp. NPDC019482 TaxID=3154688 RepID=UPI0034974432